MRKALLLLLVASADADIPAHCLSADVLGTWEFTISAPVNAASVSLACDQLEVLPYKTVITLEAPTRAVDDVGNVGSWTMGAMANQTHALPALD